MNTLKTYDIKFLLPKSDEWESLTSSSEEESEKSKAKQNQEKLNQQLLSAMQMQNLVVLAGSGTSLGKPGGPSMKDLWDKCTKSDDKYTATAKAICTQTGYDIANEDKVNIEEFLSLCEAHLTIKEDTAIKDFVE